MYALPEYLHEFAAYLDKAEALTVVYDHLAGDFARVREATPRRLSLTK